MEKLAKNEGYLHMKIYLNLTYGFVRKGAWIKMSFLKIYIY